MFTTYRVPPLRRSGASGSTRPINAFLAASLCAFQRLPLRVAGHTSRSAKMPGKCGSKLANAA